MNIHQIKNKLKFKLPRSTMREKCPYSDNISIQNKYISVKLRETNPYSEFSWSVFSRIWTEYGEIRNVSPYLVQMLENANHKNLEYGYNSRSLTEIYTNFVWQYCFADSSKLEWCLKSGLETWLLHRLLCPL